MTHSVRSFLAIIVLAAAGLFLPGCVSRDLAKRNLSGVKAEVAVLHAADPTHEVRNADAVETAVELYEATAPVAQVLHLGVPEELAVENLANVQEIVADIEAAGAANPDRDQAVVRVAEELADEVRTSNAAMRAGAGLTPWGVEGILAIIGAAGALFTTIKTVNRKVHAAGVAKVATPAAAAPPPA